MSDLIGQELGAYRIVEPIGHGGMATVYKAYQPAVDRYVALKVLPAQFQHDPAFAQRFEQEARIIARLEHPHILPVYDFGVAGSISYIAMRYVTGGTLKDLLAVKGALPLVQVQRIVAQIADALDYAHSQGVIHRDIKPSNVLLDQRGDTFLTDFGIAKMLAGSAQVTGTAIIGTPAYMSPEQAVGTKIDARSDTYSLGVMLYEMAVGRVPYDAETPMGIIYKHVNDPLPQPRAHRPDLPVSVERVILKALAKDPAARFASAGELSRALSEALGTLPTVPTSAGVALSLPPPPPAGPTGMAAPAAGHGDREATASLAPGSALGEPATGQPARLVQRLRQAPRWAQAAAAATLVILLLLGIGGALSLWGRGSAAGFWNGVPTPDGTAETTPAVTGPGRWQNFGDVNRIRALAVDGKGAVWAAGPAGLVRWSLESGTTLTCTIYTAADGLPANALEDVLVARNGRVWLATEGGGVASLDPAQAGAVQVYGTADGLGSDVISRLYEDAEGTLWAFSSGPRAAQRFTGQRWVAFALPQIAFEMPAVRDVYREEDGTIWLATAGSGLLRVTGTSVQRFARADGLPSDDVRAVAAAPDGSLWVGTSLGLVRVTGGRVQTVSPEVAAFPVYDAAYDRAGRLWVAGEGGVYRLDPAAGEWRKYGMADGLPSETVTAIGETPDGSLWFGTSDGLARLSADTWSTGRVPGLPPLALYHQIVAHDDGLLLFAPDTSLLVQLKPAGPVFTTLDTLKPYSVTAIAAAPGTGPLYLGTRDGALRLSPGASNPARLTGLAQPGDVMAMAVSSDGSLWVGTSGGVSRYAASQWTAFVGAGAPPEQPITAMAAAADGTVWAGWDGGVARASGDNWTLWESGLALPSGIGRVTALAASSSREAWAGTESGGLLHYATGRWAVTAVPGIGAAPILALAVGPSGELWVGTDGAGAARFDGVGWTAAGASRALGHGTVTAIYVMPAGDVWFATGAGLAHWAPAPGAP